MENYGEFQPQSVAGKNILLTGGTTGIRRAAALLLAKQGANVIIVGLDNEHLSEALSDINEVATGGVYGLIADIGTEEGIKKTFEEVDATFRQLDILINNAALAYGSVVDGNYKEWQRIVNTNLLSYLACSHEAIARMEKKGKGHIVNVGSMSADVREEKSSVYVATKSGIQGFSASLRKQVNPNGIKITLIEPGATDTDMQPESTDEKRQKVNNLEMLTAADIAQAILYTLSQPERCDVVDLKLRPHLQLI